MTATTLAPITVNVNGKDFIVYPPAISSYGHDYYTYFSTRDGKRFGPIRTAAVRGGAKTVGRQLALAARAHYGQEAIDAARARAIEGLRRQLAEIDPASQWAESKREFYTNQLATIEAAGAQS